ncbi:unnamed protein product [Notodromas monacha]|uniref:Uncharacterized protein n=1 Tax=Notodromas monacha TaxID=399045 RepID=A0A7R9G8R4_9CRUS|nr:unnamed protein product [Notodromas monacha]CAG0913491.1 unnamed protein product [Notodromas monacha]
MLNIRNEEEGEEQLINPGIQRLNVPEDPVFESDEVVGQLMKLEHSFHRPTVVKWANDAIGHWDSERRVVAVHQAIRSRYPHLGFSERLEHYIFPEEALFLAETARLVVCVDRVPLTDFRHLYSLLLNGGSASVSPGVYALYARLARRGCHLRRLRRRRAADDKPDPAMAGQVLSSSNEDKALLHQLGSRSRKEEDRRRTLRKTEEDCLKHALTRRPCLPFPSVSCPAWEVGRVQRLSEGQVTAMVDSETWWNLRRVTGTDLGRFLGCLDQLRESPICNDELLAHLRNLVTKPDRRTLALLYPGASLASEDSFSVEDWYAADHEDHIPTRTFLHDPKREFTSFAAEKLDTITRVPNAFGSLWTGGPQYSMSKACRPKSSLIYEVNPYSKKCGPGIASRLSSLIIPRNCDRENEATLKDVLHLSARRHVGLESGFSCSDPVLIGSVIGDDAEILSIVTAEVPSADDVEIV